MFLGIRVVQGRFDPHDFSFHSTLSDIQINESVDRRKAFKASLKSAFARPLPKRENQSCERALKKPVSIAIKFETTDKAGQSSFPCRSPSAEVMFRRPMFYLLLAVLVSSCLCQEDEDGGSSEGGNVWSRLKKAVKNFVESMKGLFREMKEEIKARTSEMTDWTKEMFESFKGKMKEWVDEAKASDKEKEDMKNYIERLQMPEKENEN